MTSVDTLDLPKAKITQLKNKGLETTEDLLEMMPLHYYDFTKPTPISQLRDGQTQSIYVQVIFITVNNKYMKILVEDEFGESFDLMFFNQFYLADKMEKGSWYTIGGRVTRTPAFFSMTNPSLILKGKASLIQTKYPKVKGMSEDYLRKAIRMAEITTYLGEDLDKDIRQKFDLVDRKKLIRNIHNPKTIEDVKEAKKRLLFEDLFQFNLRLMADRKKGVTEAIAPMGAFEQTKVLLQKLPFQLTEGQSAALRTISQRMKNGKRVNSLVQGDVGSGKTMVALFALLIAAESGFQSAIMAPTNVLAKQHYEEMKGYLEPLGFKVVFLSGTEKVKLKREAYAAIKSGEANVIVGTHAVLSEAVKYHSLGLIVVDEEHRFGVKQRETFAEKGEQGVHFISMTATPIPRTLASALYGEDVLSLTIKTLPKGRKPIVTEWMEDDHKSYLLMEKEIRKGHQAYIVCPFIEDNEDLEDVESVESAYEKARKYFEPKGISVGMINGKMKPDKISDEIEKFSKKDYDILVSTTIIEVGVNVPNATVMLVKSADRFGLAQLHQLRGRVGRSTHQSFCVLSSANESDMAKAKLQAMVDTSDGFQIAAKDMELRGTGDITGIAQSGANKYIELMLQYPNLNQAIRNAVKEIIEEPKRLHYYRHYIAEREKE